MSAPKAVQCSEMAQIISKLDPSWRVHPDPPPCRVFSRYMEDEQKLDQSLELSLGKIHELCKEPSLWTSPWTAPYF